MSVCGHNICYNILCFRFVNFCMFFDTHSHIHFSKEFPDSDAVISRAREADVMCQLIVGCTAPDSMEALDFVKKQGENFWSTMGVHPHNSDELTDEVLADFERLILEDDKAVALGEMGLDYFKEYRPKEVQRHAFFEQLKLAKKLDVPVIVHVRDAWDDALDLIGRAWNSKVVLHCFSGDEQAARESLERGYHISFSGIVTYPKNQHLRDIAGLVPLDKILIETDCPYLAPQIYRGKRNEPAFVVETAREIAKVRGMDLSEFGEITTRNALALFGLTGKV